MTCEHSKIKSLYQPKNWVISDDPNFGYNSCLVAILVLATIEYSCNNQFQWLVVTLISVVTFNHDLWSFVKVINNYYGDQIYLI